MATLVGPSNALVGLGSSSLVSFSIHTDEHVYDKSI